jgi:hypothetical protein
MGLDPAFESGHILTTVPSLWLSYVIYGLFDNAVSGSVDYNNVERSKNK